MVKDCAVANELQRMMSEQKGFELVFTQSGDKISVSKWGEPKRKSYIISICKGNDNTFKSMGYIKEQNIDEFRKFLESNLGR